MTKATGAPALLAGTGASENFGGNSPQLRAVCVTNLTTTGDIGSRIKSAIVDGLLDIFEERPAHAIALNQAILHDWSTFPEV